MQTQEEQTQEVIGQEPQKENGLIELDVVVKRQVFANEDTSYYIYGAIPANKDGENLVELNKYGNISFKGFTPKLDMNTTYTVQLTVDKKSNFKGSYNLEGIKQKRPEVGEQQKDFLETILTETQVKNIYDEYEMKDDIISMIEKNEFDYQKVKGLGEKSFEKLREKVLNNLHMSEVLIFLAKYNIKYSSIKGLIKQFVHPLVVIDKIKNNPYLLTEVKGIGFIKADSIAKSVGFDLESPLRINSAIRYIIKQENLSGHCWIARKRLLSKAVELLSLKKHFIIDILDETHDLNILESKGRFTTLEIYKAENIIAETMINLNKHSKLKIFETDEELSEALDSYCELHNVELEKNQRDFFFNFNNNAISLLVGGGGMGKTWILKILLDLIDQHKVGTPKALLSPTGKASKVLSKNTERPASTIHRKISARGGQEKVRIFENIVIIDESSMCDVMLVADLMEAIAESDVKVLFVGDDFQLPSVGVGNFLYDILQSGIITVSRLKKVFRTKDGGILEVSTNIREGKKFLNDYDTGVVRIGKNAIFHLVDSDFTLDGVKHYHERLLKKYTDEEILVLSPTKKNQFGVARLNKELQEIVNPERRGLNEKAYGKEENEVIFRVGDMVMNVDNTYDVKTINGGTANVYNGDVGRILDIDEGRKIFIIDYGDDIVTETPFDLIFTSIIHSTAMTVHKSQGSQSPVVIVVLDKSMKYQLNANLLYTAVSRAQEYLIVIGDAKTINFAMSKFTNMERRSFLQELLEAYDTMNTEDVLDYRSMEKQYRASIYNKDFDREEGKENNPSFNDEEDLNDVFKKESSPKPKKEESMIDDFFDDMEKEDNKKKESAVDSFFKKKKEERATKEVAVNEPEPTPEPKVKPKAKTFAKKKEEVKPFFVSTPHQFNEVLPF